jgi:aminoglycoside 6'-N-acetyltransferase I
MKVVLLEPGDEALLIETVMLFNDVKIAPDKAAALLLDPTYFMVVALDAGEIRGRVYGNILHRHTGSDLLLYEVDTLAEHQRKGTALAILDFLKELMRKRSFGEMWVLTEQNNAAARALYKKAGGSEEDSPTSMFVFAGEP